MLRTDRPLIPIDWASAEDVDAVLEAALQAQEAGDVAGDVLDTWLQERYPNLDRREFDRRSGQLANHWLQRARDRNGGDVPESRNEHSRMTKRVTLICAYEACGRPFDVRPSERNAGREYCCPSCATSDFSLKRKGKRKASTRRRILIRNRKIMRMYDDGMTTMQIAREVGLTSSSVRRIRKTMNENYGDARV